MLYRPLETPRRPSLINRFGLAVAAALASLRRRHADTQYLDGLSPRDLEELGLRRFDDRDYPSMR